MKILRYIAKRRLAFYPRVKTSQQRFSTKPARLTDHLDIKLRWYQEECIQAVLSSLQKGSKRLGVSLATGSGKTVIFTHLIDRVKARDDQATQTLILVHRRELVEQAAKHCQNTYPQKSIDIEMGNLHASGAAEITIASVKSLISGDRLDKFRPERFKLVLVDEAHHIVASSYLKVLEHFGLSESTESSPALVGVSATMSRFDGLSLGTALDQIVYHKDYLDMIKEKWLVDVIFTTVKTKIDLRRVKSSSSGDFQTSSLSRAVNTDLSNDMVVETWKHRASQRRSTIVFCVDVAHVKALATAFRSHDIDARYIIGSDLIRTRDATLEAFKKGEFPVLLNCSIFTEGTDIPNIDCVILARPTKSRNLLVQMIGRGMRLHPSKENCHVIDIVSSLQIGVVSVPTLFGLDPSHLLEEASVDKLKQFRDKNAVPENSLGEEDGDKDAFKAPIDITYTDYDSVEDLISDTSGERHIRAISKLSWVEVGDDRYILSSEGGSYLTIEKLSDSEYQVRYTARVSVQPLGKSWRPLMRPREIAKAETFNDAIHAADTFATKTLVWRFISRHQAWRASPATEGQIAFLNKFRDKDDQLSADDLKKGQAGDMITKIKFGARGRFGRQQSAIRKRERQDARLSQIEELRKREEVHVGAIL